MSNRSNRFAVTLFLGILVIAGVIVLLMLSGMGRQASPMMYSLSGRENQTLEGNVGIGLTATMYAMEASPAPTMLALLVTPRADQPVRAQVTPQATRLVIKNANLSLVVEGVRAKADSITSMAEEMGGWVVSSETSQIDRDDPSILRAQVQIRVPAERLDEAVTRIKSGAVSILNETITGSDVTDQYTDLMSNLKNLQAAEEQLRKILEAAQATEDVLNVYRELTRVRGEIEIIQGRLNFLSQSAAYSSIVVTLHPKLPPTPTPTPTVTPTATPGWSLVPVAEQAGSTLVTTFQGLLGLLTWGLIYVLPLALVIGIPAVLLWRIAARIWPSTPRQTPNARAESEDVQTTGENAE